MKKIALLVGHNASKKGAAHEHLNEFDYNTVLANRICLKLIQEAPHDLKPEVFFRRQDLRKSEELKEIVERINQWNPDLTIEFHLNSFRNQSANGTEILIAGNMMIQKENISGKLMDMVTDILNTRNRGIKILQKGDNGWPIQSGLINERLLLESFFLSNPHDRASGIRYREALADGIADCVIDHLMEVKNES